MIINILIVVVFVIAVGSNLRADYSRKESTKDVTKPLLVPSIILFYAINSSDVNSLLIMALFFGFVGDVMLLGGKGIYTYLGMAAFLAGHIFYIITFVNSIVDFKVVPVWLFSFLLLYILYGYYMIKPICKGLKEKFGSAFVYAVVTYMCVLFSMSFSSLCRICVTVNATTLLPFVGSLLFIASDSCLAYQFAKDEPKREENLSTLKGDKHEFIIMSTYVIAQILIMLGFLV